MLTVHHLEDSRSQRILWLLEELEVDYEIERYERDPATRLAPPSLKEIHPLGKAPVITDGEQTVAESGAIIEYILDAYGEGRLRPERGTPEFLRYRYWMHYAEGSAMTPLLLKVVFAELPRQAPWVAKPLMKVVSKMTNAEYIDPELNKHLAYWEAELSKSAYFAGDEFTAADIQMSFALESAIATGIDAQDYPKLVAKVDEFRGRPAYQRAIERGGEFSLEF